MKFENTEEIETMSYRSELHEVITTVPTYVEFRTFTAEAGLPEGFMIEQDGKKFRPRYHVDYMGKYDHICGYAYFYNQDKSTVECASFEEAKDFIMGWVNFLQWMSGLTASTPVEEKSEEELFEEEWNGWRADYFEQFVGCEISYQDKADEGNPHDALVLEVGKDAVHLEGMGWKPFEEVGLVELTASKRLRELISERYANG